MKKYLLLMVLVVLLSCGNKKAAIVDRQKEIKKELAVLKPIEDSLNLAWKGMDTTAMFKSMDQNMETLVKIERLRLENDSLEIELKKY